MYKEDAEALELENLRKQIELEAQNANAPIFCEEANEEENADAELLNAVKALFDKDMSNEDIISRLTDAMNTSLKIFKPEHDVDKLLGEENEIKKVYAEFDIANELKSNMKFKRLIANGVSVHSALLATNEKYEDAIADNIRLEARRNMAELLRQGRERIIPASAKKAFTVECDVAKMSDREFEEIERKVKQNKRVCL